MALESIALAAMVAGTAASAAGSYYSGAAASAAAEYNASLLARNAGVARQQAEADRQDKEREGRRYLGTLHAAFGASGLAMEGSMLDLYEDQSLETQLAQARVRYAGELKAIGLEGDAALQETASTNSLVAGVLGAGAQVGSGAAGYYRLKAAGASRSPSLAE